MAEKAGGAVLSDAEIGEENERREEVHWGRGGTLGKYGMAPLYSSFGFMETWQTRLQYNVEWSINVPFIL